MDTCINKHHDEEISLVSFQRHEKVLVIGTNKAIIKFNNVEHFELSSFEFQNVIFETNEYSFDSIPPLYLQEYVWLNNFNEVPDLKLFTIDSSVGLCGIVLFVDYEVTIVI